jgi:glucosamine-6-phosphate deaminase
MQSISEMKLAIAKDAEQMGQEAARLAAEELKKVIADKGEARLLVATGASQFTVLSNLTSREDIDWSVVDAFHLDEYVGIGTSHSASFCRYLKERFVDQVPLRSFHYLRGDLDPSAVVAEAGVAISRRPIDLALVGIGENAHLAFNDPPADFDTEAPYIVVELDEACRQQQVGEGWFKSMADVPTHAISISIRQIMKSKRIICSVPDARKAQAVRDCSEGEVSNLHPASILQQHPATTLMVDRAAAAKLSKSSHDSARNIDG